MAGAGFYGVPAICSHGPEAEHGAQCRIDVTLGGVRHRASIDGSRRERVTEETASLYGVALDGKLALHEDDFVVLPGAAASSDPGRASRIALIHRGQTTDFPDQAALGMHGRALTPP